MSFSASFPLSPSSGGGLEHQKPHLSSSQWIELRYTKANAIVCNVFNKYYNGSARAVDTFVIKSLQEEETRLFSIQCYIEQGPTERSRTRKESEVTTKVESAPPFNTRFFTLCGGYLGGNASIMRSWEALGEVDRLEAMQEYTSIVDKILPGWDQESEIPVSKQDKFWINDQNVDACGTCGNVFTMQNRRHHCRMCFDIYCVLCCNEVVEVALCPGAPARQQRICRKCSKEIEERKGLMEVRRILRQNIEIEQSIKEIEILTRATINSKQREEAKLRQKAQQCGCDMQAVDFKIEKRMGNPIDFFNFANTTPAAHKFVPHATLEANNQLTLANRQLMMSLKVAQCRSKKFLEKMEIRLEVLREAICFGTSTWNVALPLMSKFLNLTDLGNLVLASRNMKEAVEYHQLLRKCVLHMDVGCDSRPIIWQSSCLQDDSTRQYVSDLAEVISTQLDIESDQEDVLFSSSRSSSSTSNTFMKTPPYKTLLMVETHPKRAQIWRRVYQLILQQRQQAKEPYEYDAQIQNDVQRTFGASSLRKARRNGYSTDPNTTTSTSATTVLPEVPLELRKLTLTNVLRAFASINTQVGYCQGMDYLAAMVLSIVQWNEFKAFWILTSMINSPLYHLDFLFCPGLPLLPVRCFQLDQLMRVHLPSLALYLQDEIEFPISMISTGWFMTLYTNLDTLEYEVVVRIMDCFLVSGWKLIFRIALVILQVLEKDIMARCFDEIPQLFYTIQEKMPTQLANAEELLDLAMKFKVTNSQLLKLEQDFYITHPKAMRRNTRTSSIRSDTIKATSAVANRYSSSTTQRSSNTTTTSSTTASTSSSQSSSFTNNKEAMLSPSKGKQVADAFVAQLKPASSSIPTSRTSMTPSKPVPIPESSQTPPKNNGSTASRLLSKSPSSLSPVQVPVISPVLNSPSLLELKGKKILLTSDYTSLSLSLSSSAENSRINGKKSSSPRDATRVASPIGSSSSGSPPPSPRRSSIVLDCHSRAPSCEHSGLYF